MIISMVHSPDQRLRQLLLTDAAEFLFSAIVSAFGPKFVGLPDEAAQRVVMAARTVAQLPVGFPLGRQTREASHAFKRSKVPNPPVSFAWDDVLATAIEHLFVAVGLCDMPVETHQTIHYAMGAVGALPEDFPLGETTAKAAAAHRETKQETTAI